MNPGLPVASEVRPIAPRHRDHGRHGEPRPSALVAFVVAGVVAVTIGLLGLAAVPTLWGWDSRVILTGSMHPSIRPGDVIVVAPVTDPREVFDGEIVLVKAPELPIGSYAHRVVSHTSNGQLITRGDANRDPDVAAVDSARLLGRVRTVVPFVGLPAMAFRGGASRTVVAGLVTGAALLLFWPRHGRRRARHA